ncbi:MAG: Rieske (2Fe-2S) protein, partial [Stellaceae bacterium]
MTDRYVIEDRARNTFSLSREALVSPAVLEKERRAIFDTCWIYVGHASELAQSGDFRTRYVAGRPVIFCRDKAGTIHALLNSCRHRGATVCREREGNARQFMCMYHGWTYETDGALKNVPGTEAYGAAFDKRNFALVPVPRLEHYRDFYFACFDRAVLPLTDYLAGAKEYIDLVVDQSPS